MGSNEGTIPSAYLPAEEEEIIVMVTGFAPFRAQNPKNPAWEITRSLPAFLPPHPRKNASEGRPVAKTPRVRILIYPVPIKVAYKSVREVVPRLWDYRVGGDDQENVNGGDGEEKLESEGEKRKGKELDFMIHIGMASGRKWYSIERRGHREGYVMKDVDGEILEDDGGTRHKPMYEPPMANTGYDSVNGVNKERDASTTASPQSEGTSPDEGMGSWIKDVRRQSTQPEAEKDNKANPSPEGSKTPPDAVEVGALKEPWIWEGLPHMIETDIDVDDVWKRWRLALPETDARISEDAGRYLCDFIYYSSLAELTKRDEKKRVLFLHVPVEADDKSIAKGVEITCELIRGIVESARAKRKMRGKAEE